MKKLVLFALGTALTVAASAQSWQDALLYTEVEYGGTARSVAMGNALTAVGGDLGSIGLNPAGSAVAGYSQFTITPGVSINVANAVGTSPEYGYGDQVRTGFARMKLPNLGLVLAMDTGRRSGLKRVSLGFVSNSTQDFTGRMYAAGVNSSNSYCGSLASLAAGYSADDLGTASWWSLDENPATYGLPWEAMVGYRSYLFDTVNGRYLGLTDWDKDGKNTGVLAPLYQNYGFQTKGYKHDMVFNVGFDFSDTFYLGANLGVTTVRYGQAEYWSEMPNNDAEFPAIPFDENPEARFRSLEMKRIFEGRSTGVYLKVGALWRIGALRLGAAVQTPTVMNISTRMAWYGDAHVDGVTLPAAKSPEWEDVYALISPLRANFGAAFTLGQVGLLSVDYELANYSRSYFRSRAHSDFYYGSSYFDRTNSDIKQMLGVSHMLRVGAEFRLTPSFSIRGGYSFTTTPEKSYLEWEYNARDDKDYLVVKPLSAQDRAAMCKHYFSAGLGYSKGAFFSDFAVRFKGSLNQYYTPYCYYDYDGTDYTNKYEVAAVSEVAVNYKPFEFLLTLGWRF